jgi:histidinol-phosphate aminotransferase
MTAPRYKWQPTTEQIARNAGIDPTEVIRFDHNTAPHPTHWAQEIAAVTAGGLNEYPGADYRPIREAASELTGLDPDWIVPGAGVDELILLCGRAFLGPGRAAVEVTPTYPLYRIATAQVGASIDAVAASAPDFRFPTEAVAARAGHADLVWLCVPNNPTGTTAAAADVDAVIAAARGIVVVDAAYAEFTGHDWSGLVRRHRNAIVLRTLSKAFGLAGLRVGMALAHPDLIDALDAVRPPGSISSLSVAIAVDALRTPERMRRRVADIVAARADLADGLGGLGWKVLPSETNFLLSEVGPHAADLAAGLMDRGLVVRTFPYEPLTTAIRVTVRTPAAHERLIAEIRRIP